jgi:hypothetical protein
MRYSLALRVSFGFLASLTAACGSAPADQKESSSTMPEVRAATRRVMLTTFPNAICRVHAVGSAEGAEVSADDAGEVSFTFQPDGAAEPELEADCRTGQQSRTIAIDLARAPLVSTLGSLERDALITMDAIALRATHGRFNPALVTANESAIFSTESETYFDAVTRRSNSQLRFIWNWYY